MEADTLVVWRLEAAQEGAQPGDSGQTGEHSRGGPGSAMGDTGGLAQGSEEGLGDDPDGDVGAAGEVRDGVGLELR